MLLPDWPDAISWRPYLISALTTTFFSNNNGSFLEILKKFWNFLITSWRIFSLIWLFNSHTPIFNNAMVDLYHWLCVCVSLSSLFLDPWRYSEGSYEIGSVRPSVLSVWTEGRIEVERDRAGFSWKIFFVWKIGKIDQ